MTLSDFLLAKIAKEEEVLCGYRQDFFEAMRQVIADHAPYDGFQESASWHDDQNRCSTCAFECTFDTASGPLPQPELRRVRYPCLTLRYLAVPYSDDPAFRDDWKVDES